MPRKRSRSDTEAQFQVAVLSLLQASGCAELGVNLVAQRAGYDKVLLYRYFGSLTGLLDAVASSREWLPEPTGLLEPRRDQPVQVLRDLRRTMVRAIQSDRAAHQLLRWRHAVANPLTETFNAQWQHFWPELAAILSEGLPRAARSAWEEACQLLALLVEADLTGQRIEQNLLDRIAAELEMEANHKPTDAKRIAADTLPTNLL